MKTVVLDAHALLLYLEKELGWEDVADLLEAAARDRVRLPMTVVNWGEVYYTTLRQYGAEKADETTRLIEEFPIEVVEAERELVLQAGRFKAEGGMSYADCFAAGLAMLHDGEVATGDPEFEVVEDEVAVRWIPSAGKGGRPG